MTCGRMPFLTNEEVASLEDHMCPRVRNNNSYAGFDSSIREFSG